MRLDFGDETYIKTFPIVAASQKLQYSNMPSLVQLLAPSKDGPPSPYSVRCLTRNSNHRRSI
ncbi:uncharacterized protein EI90DRAFT_3071279 [Cantharellus anzutake]|uniref:uncharacterized protein n=1 Tax=Cantharellus anzutake TaxID=1750568 RepID=UPI0019083ECB|nr:uncharacterized protein EI90DRAFT_3071279 [Cantharellus anzutake]KAF8326044.1 hypothetical protein EI90DRAFT_3071279 [Cantharellus anzutake]